MATTQLAVHAMVAYWTQSISCHGMAFRDYLRSLRPFEPEAWRPRPRA